MIASLRGTVIGIGLDHGVIECSGVGYHFSATPRTLAELRRGEESFIFTTMVVREDSMQLYGFKENEDREMFHLLQTVTGLGPKLAMASLAVLHPAELAKAVAEADSKTLQRIPGVGKRMAERMALELKEKVTAYLAPAEAGEMELGTQLPMGSEAVAEQVAAALLGLGFGEKEATAAVNTVLAEDPELTTSAALRAALAGLGKK